MCSKALYIPQTNKSNVEINTGFHVTSDLGASIPLSQSGAFLVFTTQALGIKLEDGVQEMYRRIRGVTRSAL